MFVVGHSITLIADSLAGSRVDPGWVDAVHIFGLIHGLGLASRLSAAGLPEEGLLWKVIAFNVGIEMGQVTAIFVMAVITLLIRSAVGETRQRTTGQLAAVGLVLVGVVAGSVTGTSWCSTRPTYPPSRCSTRRS